MELNDFPDELLLKIFFALPLNSLIDVFHLTLTCKKWRRILWSKEVLQRISSFKYQSRFLIYRSLINNNSIQNSLNEFLEYDPDSMTSYLTINGSLSSLKQNIQNCPLINTTISMWCRTLDHLSLKESTIFLLWHFHLGYIGFYRNLPTEGNALVKCTYTQQHKLQTTFFMKLNEWYHIAIVIKENKSLQLYINGNRVGDWPLEENINKQNISVAPYSSIWFASHCGANKWHGSLFDICLWKRCLESYEIKEMARTRTTLEKINFIPHLNL
jgi:hypothetical protein